MNPVLRTVLTISVISALFGSIYFFWLGKRPDLGLLCVAVFITLFLIALQLTPKRPS